MNLIYHGNLTKMEFGWPHSHLISPISTLYLLQEVEKLELDFQMEVCIVDAFSHDQIHQSHTMDTLEPLEDFLEIT